MQLFARFRSQPTHGSLRRLISMSLLALLFVSSIFVQGASARHAAPPPAHKPLVKQHAPPPRQHFHASTTLSRPPALRTRVHPTAGGSLQWFNQTGAKVYSTPVVANGVVYFTDYNSYNTGFLYAVNAKTSKIIWSYQLGAGTECSPTVVNGVVYVCLSQVFAIQQDPNHLSQGILLWQSIQLGPIQSRMTVAMVNGSPILYAGDGGGNFYAFDANGSNQNYCQLDKNNIMTCNPLWTYKTGASVYSSPAVATVNGVPTVYFGSDDYYVYALNASNGAFIWRYQTGGFVSSSPALATVNGVLTLYIGSYDQYLYALNAADGSLLWRYQTGSKNVYSPITSSPAVATVTINGQSTSVVYVAASDRYFYAFYASGPNTGKLLWRQLTGGGPFNGYLIDSSPTVATINIGFPPTLTPVVFVGSATDYVYALNAITGKTIWLHETGGQVVSSPVFDSSSNTVYIGSFDGRMYALYADSGAIVWSYTATSNVVTGATTAVVNGIDTVYDTDLGGAVYAFKASDGSVLWRFQSAGEIGDGFDSFHPTVATVTINVNVNGQLQPQTIPVLFIGAAGNGGHMYALNAATGSLLWDDNFFLINGKYVNMGRPVTTPAVATVTINGQSTTVLYFGDDDSYEYALNVLDGSLLWRFQSSSSQKPRGVKSSPAVVPNVIINGQSYTVLYFATFDQDSLTGYVYALDASTGTQLWLYKSYLNVFIAAPTVVGNVVYIGSIDCTININNGCEGRLFALDGSSGSLLWSYSESDPYGITFQAAVVAGVVYFSDNWGYLYALDATKQGALLWEYQNDTDFVISQPTVDAGVVYFGAFNNSVYALNASDHSYLWSFQNQLNLSSYFLAAPVVDAGRVFAGSTDGYLYALGSANSFPAPKLQVSGNQLIDQNTGQPVVLHGVNRDGTEFGCINPSLNWNHPSYNFFPDRYGVTAVELAAMRTIWHINAVRVPLNEDCWLNRKMNGNGIGGQAYINAVTNYVAALNQAGLVAILDLQWSAPKQFTAYDLESMPDNDNSLNFWTGVAQTFAGNLSVVFDAFNEPDPPKHNGGYDDSAWRCWLNGSKDQNGSCYSADPTSTTAGCPNIGSYYNPNPSQPTYFYCVGMQQVVEAIRQYAQNNVIMLGGPNFSKELNLWATHLPIDLHTNKPYLNLAIDAHMYKAYGFNQKDILTLLQSYPLIAGEVGAGKIPNPGDPTHEEFVLPTMQFLDNPAGDQSIPAQSYLGWFWNTIDSNYHMNMTLNFFPADPALCYGQGFLAHFNGQGPPANCD